jgi:hypothetical protein
LCHRGGEPLLKKLLHKRAVDGCGQSPRSRLDAYREATRAQSVNRERDGVRTSPAGTPLMIIERSEQQLIMGVHRTNALSAGDAETKKRRHLVVDHSSAHGVKVIGRQNVQ